MLEKTLATSYQTANPAPSRVLRMGDNARTAGAMPVWEAPRSARQYVEQNLTAALVAPSAAGGAETLAYRNNMQTNVAEAEFSFGDLIDMVNPLHHIPLVNHAYREITGDEIKPIGKIIGGSIFGGPAGAAAGLVDAAVTAETGEGITDHAMNLALRGDMPQLKHKDLSGTPEERLQQAAQTGYEDLPASLLAFSDTGYRPPPQMEAFSGGERLENIESRMSRKLLREPVTQLEIAAHNQPLRYNN